MAMRDRICVYLIAQGSLQNVTKKSNKKSEQEKGSTEYGHVGNAYQFEVICCAHSLLFYVANHL